MSACEICWAEASNQVMLLGGSVVDRYRKLIELSPARHSEANEIPDEEPTDEEPTS